MTIQVRLLPAEARVAAEAAWRDVVAGGARPGIAASWAWTSAWLEHFGDVVPHRFAIAERDGGAVGAALVCGPVRRRRGGVPLRVMLVGTAGEPEGESVHVEYNRLLARPEDQDAVAAALLARLHREPGWDELVLPGFAPGDATPWGAAVRWNPEPSPVAVLRGAGPDGVLDLLGSGVRRRVRQSLRAYGGVEGEWVRDPERARTVLEELIALHTRRWAAEGRPGAFRGRMAAFHRAIAPAWVGDGRAVLFRASAAGRTIGCLYGFVEDGRFLFYQSGLSPDPDNRRRPGLVTHVLCMQACRREGLGEYDFLAGDSRYKRELSTEVRELCWGELRRAGPRQSLRSALGAGRRLARAVAVRQG